MRATTLSTDFVIVPKENLPEKIPKWLQKWIVTPAVLKAKFEVPDGTIDFDLVHVVYHNTPDQDQLGVGLGKASFQQSLKSKMKQLKPSEDTIESDLQY